MRVEYDQEGYDNSHIICQEDLSHIELQLESADLKRFIEYAAKQNENYSIYKTDQTDITTIRENSFGNKISFLLYVILVRKAVFA